MNVKHPDRLSKADRLNYIVNRMRVHHDITPTDLAAELRVSERTIYRDLRNLEKGEALKKRYSRREGRYIVEGELTLPPLRLTPSEAVALYTAASNPALADDNFFSRDLHAALEKIGTALAPEAAKEVEALEDRLTVSTPTHTPDSLQRPLMERIKRAMRSNRKLCLRYWSAGSDRERSLIVSPYDLRFMRHNWYLLAKSEEHNSVRTFKISRIRDAEILPDRFRYPRRFSADAYFARAWEMFGGNDEITVQVRFVPSIAALIEDSSAARFAAMNREADGSLLCTAVVNNLKEIAWWILSYGRAAEVLAPPELRAEFAETTQAMAALYAPLPSIPQAAQTEGK
jgi:predicted DNA-binding transcriptional regulator YafY